MSHLKLAGKVKCSTALSNQTRSSCDFFFFWGGEEGSE